MGIAQVNFRDAQGRFTGNLSGKHFNAELSKAASAKQFVGWTLAEAKELGKFLKTGGNVVIRCENGTVVSAGLRPVLFGLGRQVQVHSVNHAPAVRRVAAAAVARCEQRQIENAVQQTRLFEN